MKTVLVEKQCFMYKKKATQVAPFCLVFISRVTIESHWYKTALKYKVHEDARGVHEERHDGVLVGHLVAEQVEVHTIHVRVYLKKKCFTYKKNAK